MLSFFDIQVEALLLMELFGQWKEKATFRNCHRMRANFWNCPKKQANNRQWHPGIGRTKTGRARNHFWVLASDRKRWNRQISTLLTKLSKSYRLLLSYMQCYRLSFFNIQERELLPRGLLGYRKVKEAFRNCPKTLANSRRCHPDVCQTKLAKKWNKFWVLAADRKRRNRRVSTFLTKFSKNYLLQFSFYQTVQSEFPN